MAKHEHTWRIVRAETYEGHRTGLGYGGVRVRMRCILPLCGAYTVIQFDAEHLERMAKRAREE